MLRPAAERRSAPPEAYRFHRYELPDLAVASTLLTPAPVYQSFLAGVTILLALAYLIGGLLLGRKLRSVRVEEANRKNTKQIWRVRLPAITLLSTCLHAFTHSWCLWRAWCRLRWRCTRCSSSCWRSRSPASPIWHWCSSCSTSCPQPYSCGACPRPPQSTCPFCADRACETNSTRFHSISTTSGSRSSGLHSRQSVVSEL